MSEPIAKPTEPVEIKCLKENTSITIEVTSHLHERVQNLLFSGLAFENMEVLQKTLINIKSSPEDPDPITYHARTLMWLISQIEEAAEKQGKLETKKLDRTTGKPV
jgi:flagellar biosynthesis component FlhA